MIGRILRTLILFIFFTACDANTYQIKVTGRVLDSISKKPIKNAAIYARIWVYDIKLDESTPIIDSTFTNNNGFYSFNIEKAKSIDLAVLSKEYYKKVDYLNPRKSQQKLNFYLKLKQ